MNTVKDLSIEELKALVGDVVEEKLRELMLDPDAGLTLRPEVEERLRKELRGRRPDGGNVSAAELARRRGLEW
jgi:hypothetical protein